MNTITAKLLIVLNGIEIDRYGVIIGINYVLLIVLNGIEIA